MSHFGTKLYSFLVLGAKQFHVDMQFSLPSTNFTYIATYSTEHARTYGRVGKGRRRRRLDIKLSSDPDNHHKRYALTYRLINPIPYNSTYCGEKLHIDQNEKLVLFGVTHVCAVDGHSGKIVSFVTMPVKNNAIIYEHMYR